MKFASTEIVKRKKDEILSWFLNYQDVIFLPRWSLRRKIEIFFSRSEKWKKNLFPFYTKSLILLILVDKNSFFSDFFSCEKGNSKKSLFFSHARREIPPKKFFLSWKKGNWKKNLFFAITLIFAFFCFLKAKLLCLFCQKRNHYFRFIVIYAIL